MNVFIGCSSSNDIDKIYRDSAIEVSGYLASHGYNLVVGGVNGTMGVIKDIFIRNNQGVMVMSVSRYNDVEDNTLSIYNHNTVSDRKYSLISNSNLIIFLPGGFGTIDEIFTAIESKRAGEHNNSIILVNINNYYADLIKQLDKIYKESFAKKDDSKLYIIVDSVEDAIRYIESRDSSDS